MQNKTVILSFAVLSCLVLGIVQPDSGFLLDLGMTVIIACLLFFFYAELRLSAVTYALIIFALLVHDMGMFGYYAAPPILGIPYDLITHTFGIFAATLAIANFMAVWLSEKKGTTKKGWRFKKNLLVYSMVILAGLGIGSIIEVMEFGGYLAFGRGEGFFMFGAGDFEGSECLEDISQVIGGGYFDTIYDLLANSVGAVMAAFLHMASFLSTGRRMI